QRLLQRTQELARETDGEVNWLEDEIKTLQKEERRLRAEAESLGTGSVEVDIKRNEIEQAQDILKLLHGERVRLQMEIDYNKQRITPMHRAEVPHVKSIKEQVLATLFAGVALFLCGSCLVSYRELASSRIYDADEFAYEPRVRVLGSVPLVPRGLMSRTGEEIGGGHWENVLAESISYIRTRLLAQREGQASQLVMIASASSQEGKTSLAGHL